MTRIENARIAILATDGYEKSELFEPKRQLAEAGAEVKIVSLEKRPIRSWDQNDWGETVAVDLTLDEVDLDSFDALVLPGGQINPDLLRVEKGAVELVRSFANSGKVVAAICHGPWLLVEADVVRGRDMTSYKSIRTDLVNAGANWRDAEVVTDNGIITSRCPDDLDAFCGRIIEEIEEGRHHRDAA